MWRGEIETDADGRVRICVFPGRTYEISYERPQFDQPDRHRPVQVIHVPNGVDKLDLGPIEVVQPRTINGGIENAAGQPIPGIRIRKICGGEGGQQNHGDGVSRWTTSDPAGQFRFDDVAAGTTVTLVPVRDGLPLADPVVLSLNGDQVVHLHEKKCEYAALAGRILGVDQKPIAGRKVIVEIEKLARSDPLFPHADRRERLFSHARTIPEAPQIPDDSSAGPQRCRFVGVDVSGRFGDSLP